MLTAVAAAKADIPQAFHSEKHISMEQSKKKINLAQAGTGIGSLRSFGILHSAGAFPTFMTKL